MNTSHNIDIDVEIDSYDQLTNYSILPTQYSESRKRSELSPILKLILAVLETGIRASKNQVEREWITDDESDQPFSFIWVCNALNIDHASVRNAIINRGRNGVKLHRRSPVMSSK